MCRWCVAVRGMRKASSNSCLCGRQMRNYAQSLRTYALVLHVGTVPIAPTLLQKGLKCTFFQALAIGDLH